mgnify:CR=1 FL=1
MDDRFWNRGTGCTLIVGGLAFVAGGLSEPKLWAIPIGIILFVVGVIVVQINSEEV